MKATNTKAKTKAQTKEQQFVALVAPTGEAIVSTDAQVAAIRGSLAEQLTTVGIGLKALALSAEEIKTLCTCPKDFANHGKAFAAMRASAAKSLGIKDDENGWSAKTGTFISLKNYIGRLAAIARDEVKAGSEAGYMAGNVTKDGEKRAKGTPKPTTHKPAQIADIAPDSYIGLAPAIQFLAAWTEANANTKGIKLEVQLASDLLKKFQTRMDAETKVKK